jgi:plastocyanin
MKIRSLLTIFTLASFLAACAPKSPSSEVATLAPLMTEAMESMEPISAPSEDASATSAPSEVASATSAPLSSGNVFDVEISGFKFEDNTVTIKVGDTVTWTNHDSATHTVAADDGSFKSGNLKNNASFSQTFDTAGTYSYHCGFHASMTGTVIVEP